VRTRSGVHRLRLFSTMGCGASNAASSMVESAVLLDEAEPSLGNIKADYIIGKKMGQ
jgi:hypothetical protein